MALALTTPQTEFLHTTCSDHSYKSQQIPNSSCTQQTTQTASCRGRGLGYFATDGQSVSMSWYRALLWDLRPDIISCRNVAV
jgi:hypothetical protein